MINRNVVTYEKLQHFGYEIESLNKKQSLRLSQQIK